ncbi:IS110 family transposase [Alkalibacter rhizosphaerae]|uniref:IS110 family transposase n=1 Tax=Alkalibacter rhizosphaerae TaxID=2815577 RepID=A0A975AJ71_9FIRM|nr:IS110 family transposase [Alkalibacter rhizosphaerae]QSX09280.1 IS110 family transposase [Alkalibacter rhizosphaerae]
MIYVGIDVAKDKHDCFIVSSEGEIIKDVFTISNSIEGFNSLLLAIPDVPKDKIRVGLEATGHYSINLMNFITENQLPLVVLNPLQTNLFRKAHTLRKSKTDKIDAKLISHMLHSGNFKLHSNVSYHLQELKSLTRHKSRIKENLSKYKISLVRVLDIMFPELADLVYSLNQKSTYALLRTFPSKDAIASAHLTKLTNVLRNNSKGRYGREKAMLIKKTAAASIGSDSRALSFELSQILLFIDMYANEISKIDAQIKVIMDDIQSPILSVPGISYGLGSVILAEIGDISRFESPSKLLAFAGLEPSTYQSGSYTASGMKMVKRGSSYLRWALLEAARLISIGNCQHSCRFSQIC